MLDPEQQSDPFEPGYGGFFADHEAIVDGEFSLVVRRAADSRWMQFLSGLMLRNAVILECPRCNLKIAVYDTVRWRDYGTGLICSVCAGTRPGSIVANDTLEIIPIDRGSGALHFPQRFLEREQERQEGCRERNDDLRRQLSMLEGYLQQHTESVWARIIHAKLLAKLGDYDALHGRISDLDRAVQMAPRDPRVIGWRASLLSMISAMYPDVKQQMVQDWRSVIEIDPDCADAYFFLVVEDPGTHRDILRDACLRFPQHRLLQDLGRNFAGMT